MPWRDGYAGRVRAYLGGDLRGVRWREMGRHLGADGRTQSYEGIEYTLVLPGGYTDATGSYAPEDLRVMKAGQRHNPVADPGENGINLAVNKGRLKFDSPIQKIAAPLFGF